MLTTLGSFGSWDISGLVIDPASGDFFAVGENGPNSAKVYRIDHTNWNYTLLTSNGYLNAPQGLALDSAANRLLIVDPLSTVNAAVIAVDLTTGTQTVFSDLNAAGVSPLDIAVTASGDIWVAGNSADLVRLGRTDGSVLGNIHTPLGQINGVFAAPDGSLTVAGFVSVNMGQVDSVNVTTGAVTVISSGGLLALPNAFPNRTVTLANGDVYLADETGLILLTSNGARNVISGNSLDGVLIAGGGTNGNVVEGDYIGTDATGVTAMSNSFVGVDLSGVTGSLVANNIISGNIGGGVQIEGDSSANTLEGNYIGVGADGAILSTTGQACFPPMALAWILRPAIITSSDWPARGTATSLAATRAKSSSAASRRTTIRSRIITSV